MVCPDVSNLGHSISSKLKANLEHRFPSKGTDCLIYGKANYLSPLYKGIHLMAEDKLEEVKSALSYCIRKGRIKDDTPTYPSIDVYPKNCSRYCLCFCQCCVTKLEGMDFYGEEKQKLLEEFETEKSGALKEPLGIAFITFKSYQMSKDVHDAFKTSVFTCWNARPPKSSLTSMMRPYQWNVSYAPVPEDIYWENLGSSRFWWLKYIAANTAVFIFLLILSTPGNYDTSKRCLD